jgi:hypothetical protein
MISKSGFVNDGKLNRMSIFVKVEFYMGWQMIVVRWSSIDVLCSAVDSSAGASNSIHILDSRYRSRYMELFWRSQAQW